VGTKRPFYPKSQDREETGGGGKAEETKALIMSFRELGLLALKGSAVSGILSKRGTKNNNWKRLSI